MAHKTRKQAEREAEKLMKTTGVKHIVLSVVHVNVANDKAEEEFCAIPDTRNL